MAATTALAPRSTGQVMVRCALLGLWLIMPIPVAGAVATLSELLSVPEETRFGIFSLLIVIFYGVAGAMWARGIARIFGWQPLARFGLAGALGITFPTVIAIYLLGIAEQNLAQLRFDGWQMHTLFSLLFVPTAFLIAAIGTGALGLAAGGGRLALRLALVCGTTAALTFLVVTFVFDSFGMRVGAPRAEERATMLVVTLTGMWAAALTGNAMLAWTVLQRRARL